MSLSGRFHRNHRQVAERIRQQVVASARAGERMERIAERVLDTDRPVVHLPQHVQDLREAARAAATGDPAARRAYEETVDRWAKRVQRLGQGRDRGPGAYTMRSATQQMIKDLRDAREDQVDGIIDRWTLDRARHQARQIARTETVEAYRDSYREQAAANPAVKGFRWATSPNHPRPDPCDLLAHQNLYGLGPGGYPPDAVPATPHPACLCVQAAIVDRFHTRRELARLNGDPEPPREWEVGGHETAAEWLAKQPEKAQEELLGKTRLEVFRREPHRVITAQGGLVPVHQVLGIPKRARRLGPAVNATPLVRADRARMMRPFPPPPALPPGDDGRGPGGSPPAPPEPPPSPHPQRPLPISASAQRAIAESRARIDRRPLRSGADKMLSPGAVQRAHDIFVPSWASNAMPQHKVLGRALTGIPYPPGSLGDALVQVLPENFGPGVEEFAWEHYAATQRILSARFGDDATLTFYRGIGEEQAHDLVRRVSAASSRGEELVDLDVDPLSSWSDQRLLARAFARRGAGAVVRVQVPIERVFADWRANGRFDSDLRRIIGHFWPDRGPEQVGGESVLVFPEESVRVRIVDIIEDYRGQPPVALEDAL